MTRRVFTGASLFDGARLLPDAALVVEAERVAEGPAHGAEVIALDGGILAPGFVDLQVNGGGGLMLGGDSGVAGIAAICAAHGRLGATSILPTLITDTAEATASVLAAGIAAAEARVPGFLGLHLEGPHLDPRRKGAHDPRLIRPMAAEDLAALLAAADRLPVLMVTVAPESVSADQIAALAAAGVVVSLGHSDAGYEVARAGLAAGASCFTHLFNAMSGLGHREPGMVGAALDSDAHVGLIADGVHVEPVAMRLALAAKRVPDRVFLVSDAMAVAGTGLTEFTLGGRRILRRDGRLTLGDGTLAGADVDIARSLRMLVDEVGLPVAAALRMATAVPAACVGMAGRIGALVPGAAADMVWLDDALNLRGVWRAGERIV